MSSEKQKLFKMKHGAKKNWQIHWNPWKREVRQIKVFEEIMDKKFLNLRKTINLQVQEAQLEEPGGPQSMGSQRAGHE